MIKAVIFDLDDTLYPEADYVKSGFRAVSRHISKIYGNDYLDDLMQLYKVSPLNVFDRLIIEKKLPLDTSTLVSCYREHCPNELRFYPDVMPCLKALKKLEMKTGIITDGRVEGQTAKLITLRCDALFNECIITDSLGGPEFRKPHPLAFELMAKKLEIRIAEMMYIGDNPRKDFTIRKVYPIITVRIERGDGLYRQEETPKNDTLCATINSLKKLPKLLKKLLNKC